MNDYSVIDLLNNYQLNKSKIRLVATNKAKDSDSLISLKAEMERLDNCINCLPEEEKQVITNIFIKRISERKIAKLMIMSRSAIATRREKSIKMLENLMNC